jgi:hypothetical protein
MVHSMQHAQRPLEETQNPHRVHRAHPPTSPPLIIPHSSTSITGTPTPSTGKPSASFSTSSGGDNKTNAGVIAGSAYQSPTRHLAFGIRDVRLTPHRFVAGVVGCVLGPTTLATPAFFLKMRVGRGNAANVILGPNPLTNPNMTDHTYAQPKLYNPTDP